MMPLRYRHAADVQPLLERKLPERRYLPELHGVRGLALAGVVLFHLFGNGRVSGGIDIFLAVSGFLFTGMLLREAAVTGGRIDPLKYYGRLVRRIVVPAAVVIAVTLAAGLLISPVTKHRELWAEARASLLYVENFELISSQLAYGAAGPETSPFQHFWSLSVQGQFYIVWPALAIFAVLLAKRLRTSASSLMAIIIGLILVASFLYAVYVGNYNQDEAYLMTTTRAWELAFGGILALAGGTIRLPEPLRAASGWLGLALIVSCGFILDGAQLFPGPWALWPLAGLTLVLISTGPDGGDNDTKHTASRFLSNRSLAWLGNHAYSLYLWHWPLIIYYMEIRNRDAIGWRGALVILGITIILAMVTYRFVEQPLKKQGQSRQTRNESHRVNKIVVATAATSLLLASTGTTLALNQSQHQVSSAFEGWDWRQYPGAMVTTGRFDAPQVESFRPEVEDLAEDRSELYREGCFQVPGNDPSAAELRVCEDPDKPAEPSATIVLAGGSHTIHWHAAFKALAAEYNWELIVINKSGCVLTQTTNPEMTACNAWNDHLIDWLQSNNVDLLVANGTRIFNDSPERIEEGAESRWKQIVDTGTDLLLMRGTPRPPERVDDCLARGATPIECGANTHQIADTNPLATTSLPAGTSTIDMIPAVCPEGMSGETDLCPAVVGNVVVWHDWSHLSATYVSTMTPLIEAELREEAGWLF